MALTDLQHRHLAKSPSVWLLAAWTLFVWGGRVRNISADETLVGAARSWRLGLAGSFVVLAAILVLGLVLELKNGNSEIAIFSGWALSAYGIIVWSIRGLDIVFGDHGTAFKVVHAVLATVTITLSLWASKTLARAWYNGPDGEDGEDGDAGKPNRAKSRVGA